MRNNRITAVNSIILAGACAVATQFANGQTCGVSGPDAMVGDIQAIQNYSTVDGIDAFSLGDHHCNMGNQNLQWQGNTASHPVAAQNMYRYQVVDGASRIEQIGQSWLKQAFTALADTICCNCNGQGGSVLGAGCSDPYTASRNGTQCSPPFSLGPRFEVNPHTGVFPWPHTYRGDCSHIPHTAVTRRLQVKTTDLNPAVNFGSSYFVEIQYVTPDDARAQNQDNNASYRSTVITGSNPNFNAAIVGSTQRAKPAIRAWGVSDPAVLYTNIATPELPNVGGDTTGLVILAARATDLGNNTWHYEYALFNQNSDRAISSFAVPASRNLIVNNLGFRDVPYHSGDGYNSAPGNVVTFDGADWPANFDGSNITWQLVPASPVENSNALRWGTMYNFRFDCNQPPVGGNITLGLFKPAALLPDSIAAATIIPGPIKPQCGTDLNNSGSTDIDDLLTVVNNWNAGPGNIADINNSGIVNIDDLLAVINNWGDC